MGSSQAHCKATPGAIAVRMANTLEGRTSLTLGLNGLLPLIMSPGTSWDSTLWWDKQS